MDQTPGFNTYVAAPQLFYFTPQKKWYLVFQSGPPMFSTADDPGDPTKWTEPAPFFAQDAGHRREQRRMARLLGDLRRAVLSSLLLQRPRSLVRSKTPLEKFPYGFGDPVVVMEDAEAGRMFEACNVYKINGANQYLALIEAFDESSGVPALFPVVDRDSSTGRGRHCTRMDRAVRRHANVTFDGAPWTRRHQPRRDDPRGLRRDDGHRRHQAAVPLSGRSTPGADQRLQRDPVAARLC